MARVGRRESVPDACGEIQRLQSGAGYVTSAARRSKPVYQACAAPQCGQRTVVETDAANTNPQAHV